MQFEILIKTFLRPKCLKRLIDSIKKYYPEVVIRVCDDGNYSYKPEGVEYYKLPFFSGLAVGRNYLVSKVKAPYFVFMDDDHVITKETDLDKFYKVITSANDIGIVGGRIREGYHNNDLRYGIGHLEVTYSEDKGRETTRYYYGLNAPTSIINGVTVISCRIVPQVMMCSKSLFDKYNIHWRDELKRAEHLPFFIDYPHQLKCYGVPSVVFLHKPDIPNEYKKYKDLDLYHRMVYERKMKYEVLYK